VCIFRSFHPYTHHKVGSDLLECQKHFGVGGGGGGVSGKGKKLEGGDIFGGGVCSWVL